MNWRFSIWNDYFIIISKDFSTIVRSFRKEVVSLPKNFKLKKFKVVMFNERLKQLREEQGLPLRKLAAALDIDTASYCKIEKGDRRARKEYSGNVCGHQG